MKTTIEIPDVLFKRAKSAAAIQGIPLKELVSEALADKLRSTDAGEKPWRRSLGKLRPLRKDIARINKIIAQEFGKIEPGEWP